MQDLAFGIIVQSVMLIDPTDRTAAELRSLARPVLLF